jgi:hypothetical protein
MFEAAKGRQSPVGAPSRQGDAITTFGNSSAQTSISRA